MDSFSGVSWRARQIRKPFSHLSLHPSMAHSDSVAPQESVTSVTDSRDAWHIFLRAAHVNRS
jgi:hypothetical protein